MRPKIYRQGDVLLIAIAASLASPRRWKKAPREAGRVVLAHGEVTGHSHAIASEGAALYVLDDRAAMAAAARELLASVGLTMEVRDEEVVGVLDTPDEATVVHEEHAPIPLTDRRHVVLRQREYSPEAIRQVAD